MHIALTEEQKQLQHEARAFYEQLLTPEVRAGMSQIGGAGAGTRDVVRKMGEAGWLGVGFPEEYGGRGMTPMEQLICFDESMRAGAPISTLNTIGPALVHYGTDEQKRQFLPKLFSGELQICIGYSE